MDTSETYIKMRLAAVPDMGKGAILITPTHFVKATPDLKKQVVIDTKGDWYHIDKDDITVQLERQDQLQEKVGLVDGIHYHYQDLERHFYEWIKRHDYTWRHFTASAEQLWLAFVMKENHGKVWSGKDWIDG